MTVPSEPIKNVQIRADPFYGLVFMVWGKTTKLSISDHYGLNPLFLTSFRLQNLHKNMHFSKVREILCFVPKKCPIPYKNPKDFVKIHAFSANNARGYERNVVIFQCENGCVTYHCDILRASSPSLSLHTRLAYMR